jgi:6-phosphofructokinase 1
MADKKVLAIIVGGGPAPGINAVISAAAIEAINTGFEVLGVQDGFKWLMREDASHVRRLRIEDVSRIHLRGGSVLGTARDNPTKSEQATRAVIETLRSLGVTHLVTIGGDDTALSSSFVAERSGHEIKVVHVPKTIDNDLPLPGATPTFGFETARQVGVGIVRNLAEDARTTSRWYLIVSMGRNAGHLALGIGKSAGATLTLIPEEFSKEDLSLDEVARILEGAILKRRAMGQRHGLAVIAEGIGAKLDPQELAQVPGVAVEYDPYGHVRLGEIPLATILRRGVQRRFAARGEQISIVESTLGYELRSAPPIPFDIDYTRTLGYGTVRFLLSDSAEERLSHGGLVCLDGGHLHTLPFEELRDPATGRTRIRTVDIHSEHYIATRKYMIRLEPKDLTNPKMIDKLAEAAHMLPTDFRRAFAPAAELTAEERAA